MQHHGAPTRLLDWTYSFHVATYFAAEAAEATEVSAVWAIDLGWCWKRAEALVPGDVMKRYRANDKDEDATSDLLRQDRRLIVPLNPFVLDERVASQQGLFLAPLDLSATFETNLAAMAPLEELKAHVRKYQLEWTPEFLDETIVELHRINITRRSLYPGLDGLAAGLSNLIPMLDHMPLHNEPTELA